MEILNFEQSTYSKDKTFHLELPRVLLSLTNCLQLTV